MGLKVVGVIIVNSGEKLINEWKKLSKRIEDNEIIQEKDNNENNCNDIQIITILNYIKIWGTTLKHFYRHSLKHFTVLW